MNISQALLRAGHTPRTVVHDETHTVVIDAGAFNPFVVTFQPEITETATTMPTLIRALRAHRVPVASGWDVVHVGASHDNQTE